ncbi:MAG TPA: ParB/RepB/Spo0J family partition protein [Ktedonobacteraceae bacterium]|nr:ParB/RepB/Spo0J family partition protein [Ktedonobacteraceae bacterium]
MTTDPFKSRKASKMTVQDPAQALQQFGVHGNRQSQELPALPPTTSRRLMTVPVSTIRPGRYQKRESVDPEKYQQLKDQIQELGLNFVAVLCVDPDDNAFYNPMMGGHLRIQAAAELGITEVSAILREYDRVALAKGTYFENNGRQPLSLIDEGLIFKQCQEDEGWTQEEIATKLLVPGGRSHVALCLLTVTAPPDIQQMLRKDPKRGQRCFYYLRQLDVLGEEKAMELRAPLIRDFLLGKLSTDEVQLLVKQILHREQGEAEQQVSLDDVRRQNKISSTLKSFRRFEKEIGQTVPSPAEREALLKLKEKIDGILGRG